MIIILTNKNQQKINKKSTKNQQKIQEKTKIC